MEENQGKTALLIEGARRIGKSTIAEQFAKQEYKSYILIDFNKATATIKSLFNDLMDLDYIFINTSSWDMFKYMLGTQNPEDQEYERSNNASVRTACYLYEKMMSFPEFRNRFIVSYATYLGDFLRPDVCVPLIDEMEEEIIDELPYTFAAYENMSTLKKHQYGLDRLYGRCRS